MAKHISHVKSKVVETTTINGVSISKPKLPEATDLYYGEIAVNYAKGHERLAIKNDEDEIVTFVNEKDFLETEQVIASALTDLDSRIKDSSDVDEKLAELEQRIEGEITELLEDTAADISDLGEQISELTEFLEESERVTAESLNDLDSRLLDVGDTVIDVQSEIVELSNNLEEVDKVTSQGLTDLDSRMNDFDFDIQSIQRGLNDRYTKREIDEAKCTKITYADLVDLMENAEMIPGTFYRITDYVTTTTQANTQAANHLFDLIVLALDEDKLSANAKAVQHTNSPYDYFVNNKLDAWEIKYDINNNTGKYAWADEANGKGVIYYMKDEFGNECPYDFKNIQFERWKVTNVTNTQLGQTSLEALKTDFIFDPSTTNFAAYQSRFAYKNANCIFGSTTFAVDSTDSDFYYTFSTVAYDQDRDVYSLNTIEDASLRGTRYYNSGCYGNIIKPLYDNSASDDDGVDGVQILNNIVFNGWYNTIETESSTNCSNNHLDYNSSNCTFGCGCISNTAGVALTNSIIGNNSVSNTFKANCYSNIINLAVSNTFGYRCYNNTLTNGCSYNRLEDASYGNNLSNNCTYNVFGAASYSNKMLENCKNNVLDGGSYSNNFAQSCSQNVLGSLCSSNTLGNNCKGNSFGNTCTNNTLAANCNENYFGNNCARNTLGATDSENSFGNGCNDNNVELGCYNNSFNNNFHQSSIGQLSVDNTFGCSCGYITFGTECCGNQIGNQCTYITLETQGQSIKYYNNIIETGNSRITLVSTANNANVSNVTIAQGTNTATTGTLTISHNPSGGAARTVYQLTTTQTIDPTTI